MEDLVEVHVIVHGHVQGVFFRDTTRQLADTMKLTGTVQNLLDGTVEIYVQGQKSDLEDFLNELTSDAGPGVVEAIDKNYSEPNDVFDQFKIIY